MFNIGVTSYLAGGLLFLMLAVLLLTGWRGRLHGALLAAAALGSFVWCMVLAYAAMQHAVVPFRLVFSSEMLRNGLWLVFLLKLLAADYRGSSIRNFRIVVYGVWGLVLVAGLAAGEGAVALYQGIVFEPRVVGLLLLALIGLVLIEQLYRNANPEQRWALKFLCFGLGGMFVYDLLLYSGALLFLKFDPNLWNARGAVNAMVVPCIAISVVRNPQWSLDIFVSRRFVFYGATLIGAGLLLLGMSLGGYYIRLFGGDWGTVAQVIVVSAAVLALLTLLFSGQVRARTKVFLSKHFYHYKYDYREEWLRFIATLAEGEPGAGMRVRVVQALAQIVDATTGRLWMRNEAGDYVCAADWNLAPPIEIVRADDPLIRFLVRRNWVIDLGNRGIRSDADPDIPGWLAADSGAWLVVPLRHHDQLTGFVLLGRPRAPRATNWEDWDLLKTAGRQAAGYLALLDASEALGEARQFEAFNRLSAYVVHDLKNLVAQLALVVSNARHHRDNPEFMTDAIGTVEHAVERMNHLLLQLRKSRFEAPRAVPVRLDQCLTEVIRRRSGIAPKPIFKVGGGRPVIVLADRDRLAAVIEHLVQNAQEATGDGGSVEIRLDRSDGQARIRITDNGAGMDAEFVRNRLFRPFDTTKGNAGMGIGVYEAREFVLTNRGRLDVESEPGRGSVFTILLPQAPSDIILPDDGGTREVAR